MMEIEFVHTFWLMHEKTISTKSQPSVLIFL